MVLGSVSSCALCGNCGVTCQLPSPEGSLQCLWQILSQETNKILRYKNTAEFGNMVKLIAVERQAIPNQAAILAVAEHVVLIEEEDLGI